MNQPKNHARLSRLTVVVLTVPRQVPYIHQTLSSILSSGPEVYNVCPIHVVVDSCDGHYLAEYAGRAAFELHRLGKAEAAEQASRGLCARFCAAYSRCLAIPSRGGLVVVEDDVVVRDGFLNCLSDAINEMENEAGLKHYVLSLHAKHNLPADPSLHRGRFYISSPASRFYGTQGMYYPESVIPGVLRYLHQHGVTEYRRPRDLLIGEFTRSHQNLYNTVWDLVEHTGNVSTGLGAGRAFVSATFREPWRPLVRPLPVSGHHKSPEIL